MSLMILGTSSDVGKSVITAGICRILSDRGIRVSPFKSQNMSLNSYVTQDGGEMGLAQAAQAMCARTAPSALMNPILLKPKKADVSQIILLGKPYKDANISGYYENTEFFLEKACDAYGELAKKYDEIIIEGAGGAAELNLYEKDIANVLLARRLKLPIILVADIERGGVFAQIYGTISLLPEDIRPLVKGIIINKFRGDAALFESGVKIIEELCNVPVLGVVSYTDLSIPNEDSMSLYNKVPSDSPVKIAIIRHSHISNFTDFSLLERAAHVEYVCLGSKLDEFDAVILPGSQNTVSDLKELIDSGTGDEIIGCANAKIPVIGICGGYQMMGETIFDNAVEGDEVRKYKGLGLLKVRTEFLEYNKDTAQKTRTAVKCGPILSNITGPVHGFENHSGVSKVTQKSCFTDEGAVSDDGLIFGTNLHNLFARANTVNALVGYLSNKKGVTYTPVLDEDDFCGRFAAHLESCLNTEKIIELATDKNRTVTTNQL